MVGMTAAWQSRGIVGSFVLLARYLALAAAPAWAHNFCCVEHDCAAMLRDNHHVHA